MWILVGANGQLGKCLQDCLRNREIDFIATSRKDFDITNENQVFRFFEDHPSSVVVNAAAWTAVDEAEDRYDEAYSVNAEAVKNLAKAAYRSEMRLIHISTDYVFDGQANSPYSVESTTNPINAYGRTKLEGEKFVTRFSNGNATVIRTAWLYSEFGRNFVKTMVGKALNQQSVRVVDDQLGQPTNARDLADLITQVGRLDETPQLIHGTNSGSTSWYGLTKEIFEFFGCDTSLVIPVTSGDFPTKAKRPKFSVFSHDEFETSELNRLPAWKDSLKRDLPLVAEMVERGIYD